MMRPDPKPPLVTVGRLMLATACLLTSSGCAIGYYMHAKDEKLRLEAARQIDCPGVEVVQRGDERARVRGCGATWECYWQQDREPDGFFSTEHGHWDCR